MVDYFYIFQQMYKNKRTDFIETDLKSQLMESFDQHMVTMETMRQDFEKYKTRLGVVRQEKEKARLELLGNEYTTLLLMGCFVINTFRSTDTLP